MARPVRIANCSGFLGDRIDAASEMVRGGPIDVLTGDYLAELTMAIFAGQRRRNPELGYAAVFLEQMESVLETCVERGIKVVANAGGLNPGGLAARLGDLASGLGVSARIATVTGDDLMPRMGELAHDGVALRHIDTGRTPAARGLDVITANAYLGGWGIAEALARDADIVIGGRISDASLTVGPAAWWHGWGRDDWDALAGGVVAGHIIECGAQATGGNYSFFEAIPGLEHPGLPIAEVASDGAAVITKHPGTGGAVTPDTVTAQLLYEVGGPRYLNPDVAARLDTVRVEGLGADRVRVSGTRGEPPASDAKVAVVGLDGFRNVVRFVITGLDIEAKAHLAEEALWRRLGGKERFAGASASLLRAEAPDPATNEAGFAYLVVTVIDPDPDAVGRAFSNAAVELALANYPGFLLTEPPRAAVPNMVFWPATIPADLVLQEVTCDGVATTVVTEAPAAGTMRPERVAAFAVPEGETVRVPLGRVVGTRSGDKGGDANLGVWARCDEAYAWLGWFLTVERLAELLPEVRGLTVERHLFPNLRAVNFVIKGLLGEGAASSTRFDPQAKTLGEYLRAKVVEIPEHLLAF